MTLFDRYITRNFVQAYLYCIAGFISIWLIFDVSDSISTFLDQHLSLGRVLEYYGTQVPQILVILLPISLLLQLALLGLLPLLLQLALLAVRTIQALLAVPLLLHLALLDALLGLWLPVSLFLLLQLAVHVLLAFRLRTAWLLHLRVRRAGGMALHGLTFISLRRGCTRRLARCARLSVFLRSPGIRGGGLRGGKGRAEPQDRRGGCSKQSPFHPTISFLVLGTRKREQVRESSRTNASSVGCTTIEIARRQVFA